LVPVISTTPRRIVGLLGRYVPDREARDRVLVDNPAKFFGFD